MARLSEYHKARRPPRIVPPPRPDSVIDRTHGPRRRDSFPRHLVITLAIATIAMLFAWGLS